MKDFFKEFLEAALRRSVTMKALKDAFADQQAQISGQEDRLNRLESQLARIKGILK